MPPLLNLAAWIECSEAEGPGKRFALWVQGCIRRCPGCCNPEMHPLVPRHLVAADEILRRICEARGRHGIEGVTFVGGEPMLQAKGLASVARGCQAEGLSVMTFTGYALEELEQLRLPGAAELIACSDIVVDGPYLQHLRDDSRNWVGSSNREFHFLTNRYHPGIEFDRAYRHVVEVRLGQGATLHVNGDPEAIRILVSEPRRSGQPPRPRKQ